METKLYSVRPIFARDKKIPVFFAAKKLVETSKAIYVYGKGTLETKAQGVCCVCGRTLTHPVSVTLGIGPECGSHWWDWNAIGGYNAEVEEALKIRIEDIIVDTWIPKSIITSEQESSTVVEVPPDHKMLQRKTAPKISKKAMIVKFQDSGKPAIKIEFPFNMDVLQNVKTLAGRKFHNEGVAKYWTCPLSLESVERLQKWGFELDGELIEYSIKSKVNVADMVEIEVPGLQMELYPFQKKGVAFIEAKDGNALIGDEMGLGKTAQALAWLQLHPKKRPVIIVVPASLKLNWLQEAHMWMEDPKVQILSGTKVNTPLIGEIIIINYDILKPWLGKLQEIKAKVLITDECHYFKNNKAQRTKAIKALGKKIPHILCLSGTPIVNRPMEGFNALKLIDPGVVGSFWDFAYRYCGAHHTGFGWDFNGASNTAELHHKLTNTVMIRRKKSDVLKDLPDKARSFLPLELSNEKEYRKAEQNFIHWLRENKGEKAAEKASNAEALAEIEVMKQLAVKGKMKQAIEWIKDFLDVDGKLVVFATHKFVIQELMDVFGDKAVKIDGSVATEKRQGIVERFQTDDSIRLFIGNIKAAGVGITLTAASNVAFLELPWTPGELIQAEDRCHRIGQKNAVNIHYLMAINTIDQEIALMLDSKRKVLDAVLDGAAPEEGSLITELMNNYIKEV